MSDVSPQKRASEVEEEAPEAKIAKLKADIKSSEETPAANGQEGDAEAGAEKEAGEKNGKTVADGVNQVLNGEIQEEDEDDEDDEDYDDEEDDEEPGEQGEAEYEGFDDSEGEDEEDDEEEDDEEENYSNDGHDPEESNGVDNAAEPDEAGPDAEAS